MASVLPTDVVPATELDIDAAALWFHATQGEIVMMGDDSRPDGRQPFTFPEFDIFLSST